ncbi:MAG: Gfo/Idh/MocA family oxidoreductase [Candidatus Sericytochromatia bacterium]
MTGIGVIGAGGWGINHVRTYNQLSDCKILKVSDLFEKNLEKVKEINPEIYVTSSAQELIEDNSLQGIVIATTSDSHFPLAKEALLKGKNVFVEKPLCLDLDNAKELIKLAEEKNLALMVGHLLLYHPAVTWIKNYIKSGELGELYSINSQRLNLGRVRTTENAFWSLAPHDVSIMMHLVDSPIKKHSSLGKDFINKGIEDTFFFSLEFENGVIGNGHVSWLDPNKTRKFTIVGSKKMIVFDDMSKDEKVQVFDKRVGENLSLIDNGYFVPELDKTEPLKLECQHFIDCIKNKTKPLTDGQNGLDVTKIMLEISPV